MNRKPKSSRLTALELKRRIPNVARVATDLYGIEFKKGVARCPFTENHNRGDRDPSLRHDRKKDRLFCASQQCFSEKGADAIALVQLMEGCTFSEALQKLAGYYGVFGAPLPGSTAGTRSDPADDVPVGKKRITADQARQGLQRQGYHPVAEFQFGVDLRKVRFDHKTHRQEDKNRAEKTFRWEHLADGIWYSGDGGRPKPLYVNRIFRERDQLGLVIGFEGEAKADAAGALGLAGFSFKDITIEQATILADCEVVLWPDNDVSGHQQLERAARIIAVAGKAQSLKTLIPPSEFPPAADIIDAVKELGWDRQRLAQFLETASSYSAPRPGSSSPSFDRTPEPGMKKQEPAYFPFVISDDSIWFRKKSDDGAVVPIRLASRIEVVAMTRDGAGENWGRLLRWHDHAGRKHEWAMPMDALATEQGAVRAKLLAEGLPFITTNARYREKFSEYLGTAPVERIIRCVPRVGWYEDTYVLPDCAIGPEGSEEILYQPPHDASHCWKVSGTLEEWRKHVGQPCSGNSRLILAASCAFAGPILKLVGAESGGIHFHGPTSTGKTTALVVGGSVCGGGGNAGFAQTWRTTINGLEATAEAHNDGTLFLDELAQVDPEMPPRRRICWRTARAKPA